MKSLKSSEKLSKGEYEYASKDCITKYSLRWILLQNNLILCHGTNLSSVSVKHTLYI